jgi:hypothetical protein
MLHDMGGLFPARPGTDWTMYNALRGRLNMARMTPALTWEVIVCLATPGFHWKSWAALMGWSYRGFPVLKAIVEAYTPQRDRVEARAQENMASITREDGLDWLRAVTIRKPHYSGPVPHWTALALRDVWAESGQTQRQVMDQLGFKVKWATSWLGQPEPLYREVSVFDQLLGN